MAPPFGVPLELDAIFRAYAGRVAAWAAYLGGPLIEPEDVVQEVFVKVSRLLPSLRDAEGIAPWLYRITANTAREQRRKARWRRFLAGSSADTAGHVASHGPTPLEEVERRRAQRTVHRILDRLGERDRRLLVLFEIDELPGLTVSVYLGIPPARIWVALHRARARFLRELQREERRGKDVAR